MNYIETAEIIDKIIIEYGNKLITGKDLDPNNTYRNTVFHNIQISKHAWLYKEFNGVYIWLISNIDESLYNDIIYDYLRSDESDHGKKVFNSYLKHKDYFENEYFKPEKEIILNKEGLIFTNLKEDENKIRFKECYFYQFKLT